MRDYYQVLGVQPSASAQTIKARYRFLSQAYHPDKFSSPEHKTQGEAEFKVINEAYQTLSDPHRRMAYDSTRRMHQQQPRQEPPKGPPSPEPVPPIITPEPRTPSWQMPPLLVWLAYKYSIWMAVGLIVTTFLSVEECYSSRRASRQSPTAPPTKAWTPPPEDFVAPSEDLVSPERFAPSHRRFFTAWLSEEHFVTLRDDFTWTATPETQRYLTPEDDLFWGRNDHARVAFLVKRDLSALGLHREHIVFLDKRGNWWNSAEEFQKGRQLGYKPTSAALGDGYPGDQGTGVLIVDNGTANEAVVKLIDQDSGQKACSLILQAKNVQTLTGIPVGTYRMVFGLGKSIVGGTDEFQTLFACSQFDKDFVFRTVSSPEGLKSSIFRVTLHSVPNGRASTSAMRPEKFQKY